MAKNALHRGRPGETPGAAGGSRAIQASVGARKAPGDHSARGDSDTRRRRQDAHVWTRRTDHGGRGRSTMTKRALWAAAILAVLLAVAACGGSDGGGEGTPAGNRPEGNGGGNVKGGIPRLR